MMLYWQLYILSIGLYHTWGFGGCRTLCACICTVRAQGGWRRPDEGEGWKLTLRRSWRGAPPWPFQCIMLSTSWGVDKIIKNFGKKATETSWAFFREVMSCMIWGYRSPSVTYCFWCKMLENSDFSKEFLCPFASTPWRVFRSHLWMSTTPSSRFILPLIVPLIPLNEINW